MISIERALQSLVYLATLIGVAPLFLHLDLFTQSLFGLAICGGVICDRRRRYWISPLPATLISFLFFFLYLIQISRANIVLPVANIMVLLLAVRLISEKQGRHILQIFVLSTFALAASTLLSLSPLFLFYLIVLILLITCGLVLLSFHGAEPGLILDRQQWRLLLTTGSLLPVGSLILMLIFFLILPRTQHPLWNFLNAPAKASVGFSDQVRPGSVAGLSEVRQTAMRVEMDEVQPSHLYWRGIVLNRTDGRLWTRDAKPPQDRFLEGNGESITQIIYIEPKSDRFLPILDFPQQVRRLGSDRSGDNVRISRKPLRKRVQFQADSFLNATLQLTNPFEMTYYLQVPENVPPRVSDLAARIRASAVTQAEKLAELERFFLAQELSYSSTNLPPTDQPVDTFLFETKRGYCEYFASSFALVLRLSGVPARLVGGYLGGEYNDLGGYYLIGEDMAHVWVEVLDVDGRWQRIDPSRYAVNADVTLGQRGMKSGASFRVLVDTLEYYWSRIVITYDLSTQFQLLRKAGGRLKSIRSLEVNEVLKTLFVIIGLAMAGWTIYWLKKRPVREERLLRCYLQQVEKKFDIGPLSPQTGLFDLAQQTEDPLCREFAEIYGRSVYRDKKLSAEDYRNLQKLITKLKTRTNEA